MYKTLSRLADIAALVALSWPFVGKWIPERFHFVGTILAVVLAVAVVNLGVRLIRSFRSPLAEDFPGPVWLWRLLFNRIRPFQGTNAPAHVVLRILVVTDTSEDGR